MMRRVLHRLTWSATSFVLLNGVLVAVACWRCYRGGASTVAGLLALLLALGVLAGAVWSALPRCMCGARIDGGRWCLHCGAWHGPAAVVADRW